MCSDITRGCVRPAWLSSYGLLFPVSTGGSVVEFSPATREARVRFPASAATKKSVPHSAVQKLLSDKPPGKTQTFDLMQNHTQRYCQKEE